MNEIYELERKMWDAAVSVDKSAFLDIVSQNAVMVCEGYRCTGAEYAELTADFGVSEYEISDFEITDKAMIRRRCIISSVPKPTVPKTPIWQENFTLHQCGKGPMANGSLFSIWIRG